MDRTSSDIALSLILHQPHSDGRFDQEVSDCLTTLAKRRPAVVLAFAPKAAGTFLRTAVILASDGQLVRTVYAQGGRDAQFYLPSFVEYYFGGLTPRTLVTHVHMQALGANCHLIKALSLKPVIMLRPVLDMLASYIDMLMVDEVARKEGLNCLIPHDIAQWDASSRADFMIDMVVPWYASYFATWRDFVDAEPERTLVLRFNDFIANPAQTVQAILAHSGVPQTAETCAEALQTAWGQRNGLRYNKGVSGRGKDYFSAEQIERMVRLFAPFKSLEPWMNELF